MVKYKLVPSLEGSIFRLLDIVIAPFVIMLVMGGWAGEVIEWLPAPSFWQTFWGVLLLRAATAQTFTYTNIVERD